MAREKNDGDAIPSLRILSHKNRHICWEQTIDVGDMISIYLNLGRLSNKQQVAYK